MPHTSNMPLNLIATIKPCSKNYAIGMISAACFDGCDWF
jgi:hypothetical protein